jgi:hypothetical protein
MVQKRDHGIQILCVSFIFMACCSRQKREIPPGATSLELCRRIESVSAKHQNSSIHPLLD